MNGTAKKWGYGCLLSQSRKRGKRVNDLISRQAAINAVKGVYLGVYPEDAEEWIIKSLENLPSAEQEVSTNLYDVEEIHENCTVQI